uniref:Soluble scavenger receptor cysteine-rich domain-containing protein SSC5D n=1 Tax=Erpetoichthys calabaricus TaxID=27687 RepID=A0A8C4SKS1_ERPCA
GPVWKRSFLCNGSESDLRKCKMSWDKAPCDHSSDAGIICSGMIHHRVRLAGLSSQCAGRVEVYHRDTWGTVCDKSWDLVDAKVVCRQLGCGTAVRAAVSAEFGEGSGPVWLDDVNCHNYDFTLWDCPSADWGESKCLHRRDAGVVCSGNDLRLVSEEYDCAGKLEVFYNGTWGDVCTNGIDSTTVSVICNQLGCGDSGFLKEGKYDGKGRRVKWLDGVTCHGYESVLWECPSSPWGENNCQDGGGCGNGAELQVPEESTHCAGRVQIFYDGQWGHVCSYSWDLPDAEVVCRQLGCGTAVSAPHHIHPENLPDDRLLTGVKCHGNETELGECDSRTWDQMLCQHVWDAGVICADIKMQLISVSSTCTGRVEIYYRRRWGTVCSTGLGMSEAHLICKQMNCGEAETLTRFHVPPIDLPIWKDRIRCSGNETFLWECPSDPWGQHDCDHMMDTKIVCRQMWCSGRVEILHDNTWGTLCDKNLDLQAADVICRHLYCGAAVSTPSGAYFGKGKGPIWRDNFQCNGNESRLGECAVSWDKASCDHSNDASIICSDADLQVQLKGGESRCEGTVQVMLNGTWRQILYPEWDVQDASVVCAQLNCGEALKVQNISGYISGSGPVILTDINCAGDELSLQNCSVSVISELFNISGGVGVLCSGTERFLASVTSLTSKLKKYHQIALVVSFKVRLAGHSSQCAGRVEVYYNATWGTVSSNSWDLTDAQVVCRQLGCGNAVRTAVSAEFGKSSGPVWIDEVECRGDELALWKCPSLVWQENNYQHKEDAGVVCSEFKELRLVSAEYICAGKLEIFYNGTWGDVCSNRMDSTTVNIICQQLGCGDSGLLEEGKYDGASNKVKWLDGVTCYGHELVLWQCSSLPWGENWCQNGDEARIQCPFQVRLEGNDSCAGRIQILYDGQWGHICSYSWDQPDAEVVCRQLGCGAAVFAPHYIRSESLPEDQILTVVKCYGNETNLRHCDSRTRDEMDCQHKWDAGVICARQETLKNTGKLITVKHKS